MEHTFITAGTVVNTHGVRGEVKLLPCQGVEPDYLLPCKTFYIDGRPLTCAACRVHKGCLLLTLKGVEDMDAALALKGREVSIRRSEAALPPGAFFDEELVGLAVRDAATGAPLGRLEEVLDYPAHKIYAVRGGGADYLVPAVDAFVAAVDLEAGTMDIHVWEGLAQSSD